jgi:hypothetical protein
MQQLAGAVARALQPLTMFFQTDAGIVEILRRIGDDVPSAPASLQAMRPGLESLYTSARTAALADPATDEQLATLAADLALVVGDLHALPDDRGARIINWLLCSDLAAYSPVLASVLRTLGIVEGMQIRWDRVPKLFAPATLARDVYGWGTPVFASTQLFDALLPLTFAIGMPGEVRYSDPAFLARMAPAAQQDRELWIPLIRGDATVYVVLTPLSGAGATALAATLVPQGAVDLQIPLTGSLSLQLVGASQIASGAAIVLDPSAAALVVLDAFGTGTARPTGAIEARLQHALDDWEPHTGVTGGGAGWAIDRWSLALGAFASTDALDPYLEVAIDHAKLIVAPPSGDGLLAAIVPASGVSTDISCALRWTAAGLAFRGSTGLRVRVPVAAGPAACRVKAAELSIDVANDTITVIAGAALEATIGPVQIALDRLGIATTLQLRPGNLGPCDVSIGIAPPTGAAIVLDSLLIKGGGALVFDPQTHRYGGALIAQLGPIAVAAFGLVDTRPPDGGYALLVALAARGLGIELGLGFTLDSVGGLLGLHHAVDSDAIRARLRSGGIDLFPADAQSALPSVLDLTATVFPAAHGRYVIAPTARILWRDQLSADLLVAVELPSPVRISVLGSIEAGLPTLDHRIVDLRLDVLGVWDVERKMLALDASLHDSSIADYPLAGDMALRAGWGRDKFLLLAIGGFHPRFPPPPGFPALRRLSFTAGDNPRFELEAYVAVTSNTAQIGARAQLSYHAGFDLDASLAFDALFDFVPFHFQIDIVATASISWHGHHLLGVALDGHVSGPHPWHAKGEATFSVLWWDVSVGFDHTWGDATPPPLPSVPDVAARLGDALRAPEAWSFELPPGERPWVTTAATERGHPHATLAIRQRAVPLDYDIDQLDSIPLPHAERFAITAAHVGSSTLTPPSVTDVFAPAQFTQMSTDDRLVAPSFEPLNAGVAIGGDATARGPAITTSFDVETFTVDPLAPPPSDEDTSRSVLDESLVRRLSLLHADAPAPSGPTLSPLRYALATVDGLQVTPETVEIADGATSYNALACAARRANVRVQVVAAHELA